MGTEEFAIGDEVVVRSHGIGGHIWSTKNVHKTPGGAYCVKHGSDERPEYSWFRPEHIALQSDAERTAA